MADLLINYDLSSGDKLTTIEVDTPGDVRLAWKIAGATSPSQVIELQWYIYADGEDYHHMKDPRIAGKKMSSYAQGNESSSEAMVGINAAKLKINIVVPDGGAVGAIWLYTL